MSTLRDTDMKQRDVLETIAWAEKHFGSLTTTRQLPRRDMMRAVKAGLAQSAGIIELCDGDGFLISPSRFREGFVLTEKGRAALTPSETQTNG